MLRVILGKNKVSLVDEATGLNLGVPVTLSYKTVAIEYESPAVSDIPVREAEVDTANSVVGPPKNVQAPAHDSTPVKTRRRRNSRKSITDYIEQVFLEQDHPLLMVDLVDLVVEAGYKPTSKHYKNTIRSQAYRHRPEKFCQYDENTWGLARLSDKWKREGKLVGLIPEDETEIEDRDSPILN